MPVVAGHLVMPVCLAASSVIMKNIANLGLQESKPNLTKADC